MVGHFALEYLNSHFLDATHVNCVPHKPAITNNLNHAETRTSAFNASSQ